MSRKFKMLVATAAAVTLSAPVAAIPLQFELTGSRQATFVLDSMPTPDRANSSALVGDQIFFENVEGTFAGSPGMAREISFGTNLIASLNILGTELGFTQFSGPDLFSGGADMPVFSTGVFSLTSIVSGASTLTITEFDGGQFPVPAPAALGLMAMGLAFTGFIARRRKSA
ncbi:MAG: PEP-CTERM sorting domain-containing protein [Pacificimonas sp.]